VPLEYKSLAFEFKEVVDLAGGGWQVSGYASTFGGSPDSYGDVIAAGAFAESIAARPTKFLYEHYEPIGKQIEIREDDKGLFGSWSITNTRAGEDAYKLIKSGVLDSLSIGYFTQEAEFREDGIRILRKIDLYEVSAVAIPANRNAVITDVKSGRAKPFDAHSDDVRVAVAEWMERIRSGSDLRTKEGRAISTARRTRMASVSGSLREAADEIEAMLEETAPPKAIHIGLELRRRRLERHGITMGATQ
jgi:HK97 family phage prohead protease